MPNLVARRDTIDFPENGPTSFGPEDTATTPIDGRDPAWGKDGTDERRHPPAGRPQGADRPGLLERRAQPGKAAGPSPAASSMLIVWTLNNYVLPASKPITPEISSAFTTVLTFIVSYFIPEPA